MTAARTLFFALFLVSATCADSANRLTWNSTIKLTSLASERGSTQLLGRWRLDLQASHSDWLDAGIAYEQRAQWWSQPFVHIDAPYRLAQLDWSIAEDDDAFYRHEIDRLYLALHPSWGEITIGRQAIGLGRGQMFTAVDFFAPFSPTEADREWRRGIDALRVEYRLTATTSAEVIAVANSAGLLRLRGYLGEVDAEILLGERGGDDVYATVVSAAVGDAAVHAEIASITRKLSAVVGGSYTFGVGDGLTVSAEYHYSGLGGDEVDTERLLRGDLQILGRQALGLSGGYQLTHLLGGSLAMLASPRDGSGLLMPAIHWDLSSNANAIATAYFPWGAADSEFGAGAAGLFLQLGLYF